MFVALILSLPQMGNVVGEEFHGNGHEDDAEELAYEVDTALAEEFLHLVGEADDDEHPHHVERKCKHDVEVAIHGLHGDERGERSRSCQQWEDKWHKCRILDGAGIFEDFNVENHFKRHEQDEDGAGYRKRTNIATEDFENEVTAIEETYHEQP